MRREWLGDTFDHIKGAVIAACEESITDNIHVVPMITDAPHWSMADPAWETYCWVVRRKKHQVLNPDMPFAFVQEPTAKPEQRIEKWMQMRNVYFSRLNDFDGDLFLDPDTGMAFNDVEAVYKRGRPRPNDHAFVHRHELKRMTEGNERLVILYQHKHRGNPNGYLDDAKLLLSEIKLHSFGYCLSHASMIFISRSPDRLKLLKKHFESRLKGASGRVL